MVASLGFVMYCVSSFKNAKTFSIDALADILGFCAELKQCFE